MPFAKARNPCGFLQVAEKIPCYFPCYQEIRWIKIAAVIADCFYL